MRGFGSPRKGTLYFSGERKREEEMKEEKG
jgi:hypothetical protein